MIASKLKPPEDYCPASLPPHAIKTSASAEVGVRKAIPAGPYQPLSPYQSSSSLVASTIGRSPAREMPRYTSKHGSVAVILAFPTR
jgi:hypothetical protein